MTTMEATIERAAPSDLGAEVEALHPDAFAWAMACCGRNRSLAEEVLQMAYVKVLSGEARFEGRSALKTFLYGVIRKTAAEERRRLRLIAERLARFARLAVRPAVEEPGDLAPLALAMARLSARQREVLHLVFAEDFTVEGAAAVMGIGVGSARVHYDRGKKRLRALLGGAR
jgi:RNA polymerase sigma-70 factor (ECF subfamily)